MSAYIWRILLWPFAVIQNVYKSNSDINNNNNNGQRAIIHIRLFIYLFLLMRFISQVKVKESRLTLSLFKIQWWESWITLTLSTDSLWRVACFLCRKSQPFFLWANQQWGSLILPLQLLMSWFKQCRVYNLRGVFLYTGIGLFFCWIVHHKRQCMWYSSVSL